MCALRRSPKKLNEVEERRQQLIGVALELFSRRSPDEVSIDEIAS
ncbi:TetR family transcriptional regulator, partial [Streptomyces sp. NPDC007162]